MKKKRGYVRQLKRELKGLQEYTKLIEDVLNNRIGRVDEISCSLSTIRNRIRVIQCSYTFDLREMVVSSHVITIEDVKRNMVKDLLHNEYFLDAIKVEHDENYVGIGSRLNLSIEILTPEKYYELATT